MQVTAHSMDSFLCRDISQELHKSLAALLVYAGACLHNLYALVCAVCELVIERVSQMEGAIEECLI